MQLSSKLTLTNPIPTIKDLPLEFKKWTGKNWRYRVVCCPCRALPLLWISSALTLFQEPINSWFDCDSLVRVFSSSSLVNSLFLLIFFRGQYVCVLRTVLLFSSLLFSSFVRSFLPSMSLFSLFVRSPVINSLVNLLRFGTKFCKNGRLSKWNWRQHTKNKQYKRKTRVYYISFTFFFCATICVCVCFE